MSFYFNIKTGAGIIYLFENKGKDCELFSIPQGVHRIYSLV